MSRSTGKAKFNQKIREYLKTHVKNGRHKESTHEHEMLGKQMLVALFQHLSMKVVEKNGNEIHVETVSAENPKERMITVFKFDPKGKRIIQHQTGKKINETDSINNKS
jgi:hypothetical protein